MLEIGTLFLAERFQAGTVLWGCLGTGTEGVCTRGEGYHFDADVMTKYT